MHRSGHVTRVSGVPRDSAGQVYLDATCGLGGHTGAIASAIAGQNGSGFLIACDRDAESLELARANTLAGESQMRRKGRRGASAFITFSFFDGGDSVTSRECSTTGRTAGGLGRIALSTDRRREGVLADGGRAARHAHGSQSGPHCRGSRQLRIGKAARRFDLQIGRGKEEPEDSQSNRAGAAGRYDRSVGQADRKRRAPYGQAASRHADVHGAANCRQSGERRAGRPAP